jgi:hypothetical protein
MVNSLPLGLIYLDSRLLDGVYTSNRCLMELIHEVKESTDHTEEVMSEPVNVLLNHYFTPEKGFSGET